MGYVIWTLVCLAIGFGVGAITVLRFLNKRIEGGILDGVNVFDLIRGNGRAKVETEEEDYHPYNPDTRRRGQRVIDDGPDRLL